MTKVKIKKYELVEHEIEVQFPYFGHNFDSLDNAPVSWDTYVKIDESGSHVTLTVRSDGGDRSFEFTTHRADLNFALSNYAGYVSISEEKFNQAVWAAMDSLSRST